MRSPQKPSESSPNPGPPKRIRGKAPPEGKPADQQKGPTDQEKMILELREVPQRSND